MKITLIMVMTADGVIAKNESQNSFGWNSKEDQQHFRKLSREIGTVILGSNTYKAAGEMALKERNNIVLTSKPDQYKAQDYVVFMSGSPREVVKELSARGIKHAALIGGATVNGKFLKEGLVDEIYLTIEPKMFGKGLHISENEDFELQLQLMGSRQLNDRGTLLLHYSVIKNGSK